MDKKEIKEKVKKIINTYQLILDLKMELYSVCPKEKKDELHEELRTFWWGSDIDIHTRKVCNIIGTSAKKSAYKKPALSYDERSKAMSLTAKSGSLEMRAFMQSDPNFVETIVDMRKEGEKKYDGAVKVNKKTKSSELEVFLYGDFVEDGSGKNYRRFVKRVFEKKKD